MALHWLRVFPFGYRQKKTVRQRRKLSKDEFIANVVAAGGSAAVASRVWDVVSAFVVVPGLSPHPDDDFAYLFGIAEEELEVDLIAETCETLGLEIPSQELIDSFGELGTLRQVIGLIGQCRPRI